MLVVYRLLVVYFCIIPTFSNIYNQNFASVLEENIVLNCFSFPWSTSDVSRSETMFILTTKSRCLLCR